MPHQTDYLNRGSFFCSECNLCSLFSCPIDLDPKTLCTEYKRTHQRNGAPLPEHPFGGPHPDIDGRRVSISQLIERLGLVKWNGPAPLLENEINVSRVKIPLAGPFGVTARPIVPVGRHAHRHLARLVLDGDKVVHEEQLLRSLGKRIRDVRQGPDGMLWLLTDDKNGEMLRLSPAGDSRH